jgi:hypothetical protein
MDVDFSAAEIRIRCPDSFRTIGRYFYEIKHGYVRLLTKKTRTEDEKL